MDCQILSYKIKIYRILINENDIKIIDTFI